MKKHTFFHYLLTIILKTIKGLIYSFVFFLLGLGGYFIFQSKNSPYNVIIGIPLMGIGFGLAANYLWGIIMSFSWDFNKGACFICQKK